MEGVLPEVVHLLSLQVSLVQLPFIGSKRSVSSCTVAASSCCSHFGILRKEKENKFSFVDVYLLVLQNIQWFNISDLPSHKKDTVSRENLGLNPNAFYIVMPFVK